MANFAIDDFWKSRLPQGHSVALSPLVGWDYAPEALATFCEAPPD